MRWTFPLLVLLIGMLILPSVSAVSINLNYPQDNALGISLNPNLSVAVSGASSAYNITFFEHVYGLPDEFNHTMVWGGSGSCDDSNIIRGPSYAHDGNWSTDVYADCHSAGADSRMRIFENYTGITDEYVIYRYKFINPWGAGWSTFSGLYIWNYTLGDYDHLFLFTPYLHEGNRTWQNPSDYIQGGKLVTKIVLRLSYGSDRYYESTLSSMIYNETGVLNNTNVTYSWLGRSYSSTYDWSVMATDNLTFSPIWNFTTIAEPEQQQQSQTGLQATLSGAGSGLGFFLDEIREPTVDMVLGLGFIAGILMIIGGIAFVFTDAFSHV